MSAIEIAPTGSQKSFLFCSEFHFQPEGVRTVRESLEDELKANNLVCVPTIYISLLLCAFQYPVVKTLIY